MKHVLLLGAGLVSHPIIDYLTQQDGIFLTVADISIENAQKHLVGKHNSAATALDINDTDSLDTLISGSDIVVSLLPFTMHTIVAKHCIKLKKSMVNASYVSDELKALDASAKDAGILILCEMGLDPGIDHMSAMKIIRAEQKLGHKIEHFHSYCGGIPSPEAANNPFKYKFSWSPKGVLIAGNSSAKYLENDSEINIDGKYLFDNAKNIKINQKEYEAYPNRDSLDYINIYGLNGVKSMMRGTLRYKGWSLLLNALKDLNILTNQEIPEQTCSFLEILNSINNTTNDANDFAHSLLIDGYSKEIIDALKWLGFLVKSPILGKTNHLSIVSLS